MLYTRSVLIQVGILNLQCKCSIQDGLTRFLVPVAQVYFISYPGIRSKYKETCYVYIKTTLGPSSLIVIRL